MMASFKTVLILIIGLQAFALTSSVEPDDAEMDQDALKKVHSGKVCQECTEVIEFFQELLSNKLIQDKMEDLLAHVCADLAGSSTVCEKQAKEMLPLVIKMLTTFTQPQEVCEILRACDSGRMYRSMLLSYDARAAEANFFKCKVCETVMEIVNGLLSGHRTQASVAAALKRACGLVPFGMGGLCRRIVGPFSKELIHLFLENASPRTICSAIHMCRVFEESFVEKTCETCSSPFSWVHDDGV